MQPLRRLVPTVGADQVVPLRDEVPERTSGVAEGDAAVHASADLFGDDRQQRARLVHLPPVADPHMHGATRRQRPQGGQEATRISHEPPPTQCSNHSAGVPAETRSVFVGWRSREDQPCAASIISSVTASSDRPSRSAAVRAASTRLKSSGRTLVNRRAVSGQSASSAAATDDSVSSPWRRTSSSSSVSSVWSNDPSSTMAALTSDGSRSRTYATPPDMPAAKLRPTWPRTTTRPPVMYSQPWSPTPSTTAVAPELRTQNRSPAMPRTKSSPAVAPYAATLPATTLCSAANGAARSGRTTTRPPDRPLAR